MNKSVKSLQIIVVVVLCVFSLGMNVYLGIKNKELKDFVARNIEYIEVYNDTAIIDTTSWYDFVLQECEYYHIQHPQIVYAQAVLESGNFMSDLYKNNCNIFAMTRVKSRPTTQLNKTIEDTSRWGIYCEPWDCFADYAIWQGMYANNLSDEQYLDRLQQVYAEDPHYKQKLIKIIKSIK